ncbi:PIN domain-containing protein [Brevundimonas sp.]|uniref:PIN domain-containing protein n=1 Tax=Brevundimonas sp. TaxID=1871086 RepID=UPI003562D420
MLALDTDTVINLLRRRRGDFRRCLDQARLKQIPLAVSSVVVHELATGGISSERPEHHLEAMAEFLEPLEILELSGADAIAAAEIRAQLARLGTPIGALDTLIAGQALARDHTLVTSNVRHFGRVEGLRLIDWGIGPGRLTVDQVAIRVAAG